MPRYVCLIDTGSPTGDSMGRFQAQAPAYTLKLPNDRNGVESFRKEFADKRALVPLPKPATFIGEDEPVPPGFKPAHRFDADDQAAANAYFRTVQDNGMPPDPSFIGNTANTTNDPRKLWRFRGAPHYYEARRDEFGLIRETDKDLSGNPQVRQITTLLNQMTETYHKSRKQDGAAQVLGPQRQAVEASLKVAEKNVSILGLALASMMDAMDSAWRAFGFNHKRGFRLVIGDDPVPPPPPPAAPGEPETTPESETKPNPPRPHHHKGR